MPQTITTTVYRFDELSKEAKETARTWWKDGMCYEWWDSVYEDAVEIGKILGIHIGEKESHGTAIYFSGFSCQGDGASFDGRYYYAKKSRDKIRSYAPNDKILHDMADDLLDAQRRVGYSASATMKLKGRYCHANCMEVEVDCGERYLQTVFDETEEWITERMRDFANWIYRQLEKEYDYITSDEAVDGTIICNDYMFAKEGTRLIAID